MIIRKSIHIHQNMKTRYAMGDVIIRIEKKIAFQNNTAQFVKYVNSWYESVVYYS
jgi:hypothetical protein